MGKQVSFASRLNFFFYILAYAWLITSYLEKIAFGSRVCKREIRFSIKNINRVQIKEVRIGENSWSNGKVVWAHDQTHWGDHFDSTFISIKRIDSILSSGSAAFALILPTKGRVNFVDSWHILITTTYNSFMGYSWPRANCNESGHFFTGWVMEEESRFTVPSLCMCKTL